MIKERRKIEKVKRTIERKEKKIRNKWTFLWQTESLLLISLKNTLLKIYQI